jgi:hypothetical protein
MIPLFVVWPVFHPGPLRCPPISTEKQTFHQALPFLAWAPTHGLPPRGFLAYLLSQLAAAAAAVVLVEHQAAVVV